MPGPVVRQAGLCILPNRLRVAFGAETHGVERRVAAKKQIAFFLAKRTQRTKSKCSFQALLAFEQVLS